MWVRYFFYFMDKCYAGKVTYYLERHENMNKLVNRKIGQSFHNNMIFIYESKDNSYMVGKSFSIYEIDC